MSRNILRVGENFYYSIRVKDAGHVREFRIDKCKVGNPFHYAHRLCDLVYKTPEETEKEILKRINSTFDKYITIKGEVIYGKEKRKRQ
jgi:hypothetical protein